MVEFGLFMIGLKVFMSLLVAVLGVIAITAAFVLKARDRKKWR